MLRTKIQDDSILALKSGDKKRLEILRFVIAAIKNKEIEKKTELNDEETIAVLKKIAKELKESVDAFTKGNRQELANASQQQLTIVLTYLPAEMSDEDIAIAVKTIIEKNKAVYDQNKKAIIGLCMKELKSKADSTKIMNALKPYLT